MNTPLNNCSTCDHKKHPDGGHCYMFRQEPKWQCQQHTALRSFSTRALMNAQSKAQLGFNCEAHLAPLINKKQPDYEAAPLPEETNDVQE